MNRNVLRGMAAGSAALLAGAGAGATHAAVTDIQKVVISGDLTPDGQGVFRNNASLNPYFMATPQLNNQGQVIFRTNTAIPPGGSLPTPSGLFQATTTPGSLIQVMDVGDQVPEDDDRFGTINGFTQNDSGQVAFRTTVAPPIGQIDPERFRTYLWNGASIAELSRNEELIPGTNLQFGNNGPPILLNNAGQVALAGVVDEVDDPADIARNAIARFDGTTPSLLYDANQPAPGGGTVGSIANNVIPASFNNAGATALIGSNQNAIYRSDGTTLIEIARPGDAAPLRDGSLSNTLGGFTTPSLNDHGQVAFTADIASDTGSTTAADGVFIGDGTTLEAIARRIDVVPPGTVFDPNFLPPRVIFQNAILNNAGQVAFAANYSNFFEPDTDYEALFLGDSDNLTEIVRLGDPTPTGVGNISKFMQGTLGYHMSLNHAGQLAFLADVDLDDNGTHDLRGIFAYDGTELIEVLREGDALFGSTVTELTFVDRVQRTGFRPDVDHDGLNDQGQLAFAFGLADNRAGIAIAQLPFMIPGDANGDGFVTVADFAILQNNFNMPGTFEEGDFNGDGMVTFADFAILQNNFTGGGSSAGLSSLPLPAVVPEPTTLAWIGIASVGWFAHSRRRVMR